MVVVVEGGARPLTGTGRGFRDGLERVGVEMLAHVLPRDVPDREQHALALVVARAVLVRLAERKLPPPQSLRLTHPASARMTR